MSPRAFTTPSRSRTAFRASVAALLLAGTIQATPGTVTAAEEGGSRIAQGFRIAPVPLKLKGLDRGRVGLGSYIVNAVGGCNDCHTNPSYAEGGDPFKGERTKVNVAGYLAGGSAFGPFISANLTPDAKGRPAGLTYAQFVRAFQHGKDFGGEPGELLQVMPWPAYRNMTDGDVRAVYEYLRAIPPIASPPP